MELYQQDLGWSLIQKTLKEEAELEMLDLQTTVTELKEELLVSSQEVQRWKLCAIRVWNHLKEKGEECHGGNSQSMHSSLSYSL